MSNSWICANCVYFEAETDPAKLRSLANTHDDGYCTLGKKTRMGHGSWCSKWTKKDSEQIEFLREM